MPAERERKGEREEDRKKRKVGNQVSIIQVLPELVLRESKPRVVRLACNEITPVEERPVDPNQNSTDGEGRSRELDQWGATITAMENPAPNEGEEGGEAEEGSEPGGAAEGGEPENGETE
jgi:hypothetical protein